MFLMCSVVTIGQHELQAVESIEIESSSSFLADRATIKVPSQIRGRAYQLEGKIKRGDKVSIKLGYNNDMKVEFLGYVRSLKPNSPFEIECEDALTLFRKPIVSKIMKNVSVPQIAQYVVDEVNKQLPSDNKVKLVTDFKGFQFDKFTIHEANGWEVLDKLRSETGLAVFARGNDLHVNLQYTYRPLNSNITYDTSKNIRDTTNLEYQKAGDKRQLIKVIGRDAKGRRIEAEAGETGGDVRTVHRHAVSDVNTLKSMAANMLKESNYDGYTGAIQGYLQPFIEVGSAAKIVDIDYPERQGTYYVKAVKTNFSINGGIRTVELGIKLV